MRLRALMMLSLLAPAAVFAAPTLPPWKLQVIDGETVATYDFDGAKKLKTFELDCQESELKLEALENENKSLKDATDALNKAYEKSEAANQAYENLIPQLQDERDTAIKDAVHSRSRDVLDGGKYYLLGAFIAGIFLGGYIVYKIK